MTVLVRDRLTWMVYAQLGIYGYFLYGFGPTVPLLRDELGIDRTLSGLHGTALAFGAIVAGLTGTALIRRLGRTVLLWAGLAGVCVGIVGYCSAHALPLTLASAMLCGTAGSYVVNTTNSVLMDAHGESGPAALSEANAMAGGAGTVAPLVIGATVAIGLGWRAGLLVTVLLAAIVFVVFRKVRLPSPTIVELAGWAGREHSLPRRYWITWGVLICVIATEFCLSLWATDLLRTRDDLGAGAATAGLSGVLVGMTLARAAGGRLSLRHSVDWLLVRSMAVLLVGFAGFWATTTALVAYAALGVCGLGLGMLYPLTLGRAVAAAEGRSDLAATRASLGAGLAIAVGPFLLGALADHIGEHAAFLLVPVLIAAAYVGLAASRPAAPLRHVP